MKNGNREKKVRIEITVNADDGKYFPASLNRSECKVTGADFVSARALEDARLQIKVDYRPVSVLGETERAGWSSSSKKKAVWKSVEYAPGYTVTLYGDNKVVKRMTVESNSANLAEFMEDMDKTYYYEVKAVPITADEKKYLKEGQYVSSTSQEFDWDDYGEEEKRTQRPDDGGEFKGDSYIMPDGSRASNTWKKVSGKWYFFDSSGIRVKGWVQTGGRWYYMDQNGAMCTGWVSPDSHTWYYLNENGEMQTGWGAALPRFLVLFEGRRPDEDRMAVRRGTLVLSKRRWNHGCGYNCGWMADRGGRRSILESLRTTGKRKYHREED